MKKTKFLAMLLALAMLLSLTACGLGSAPAATTPEQPSTETEATAAPETSESEDPYANVESKIIRFASNDTTANWNESGYSNTEADKFLVEEIYKRTEGRYKIEVYPDGQLASSTSEQVAGLRNGDFEIATVANGSFGSMSTAFAELNVPFFLPSLDAARQLIDSDIGAAMIERAEADTGLHVMYVKDQSFRQVTTSGKEVVAPADFKGLKIRTQSDPIQMAAFEALGCAVTSIPFSELYTSLQQKVIDAEENPWATIYSKQFYEVQKYAVQTNHIFTCVIMLMSPDFWNSLTPEDQQIFNEVFREAQLYNREIVDKGETFYKDACRDAGVTVYEPTEEELAAIKAVMVDAVYDDCREAMGQERWDALNAFIESVA